MNYIGIDPGKNGGIAWINTDSKTTCGLILPHKTHAGTLDVSELSYILRDLKGPLCVVEKQQARPMQGRSGSIMMAEYGKILATLEICGIPYTEVTPRNWQKHILPPFKKGESKKCSIAHAKQYFPKVSLRRTQRCTTDHDGIADSLCIAKYCKITHQGTEENES